MADHKASRLPRPRDRPSGPATPEARPSASSSSSLRNVTPTTESAAQAGRRDDQEPSPLSHRRGQSLGQLAAATSPRAGSLRRKNRHRSGAGGFLLPGAVPGEGSLTPGHRRSLLPVSTRSRDRPASPDSTSDVLADSNIYITHPAGHAHNPRTDDHSPSPSGQSSSPGLDPDSAQIVQMALSLSASRQMASRRHASRGTPPRLAPLPNRAPATNLQMHFQQQRKSSMTLSPVPSQVATQTSTPGPTGDNTPRHPGPDPGPSSDRPYRYHFSSSTLARAQKAKDHLELMAQYRRLLAALPPLKPSSKNSDPPLGRQYNPLQYIRNRKVRARERKVTDDGDRQGFGDVESVRSWVDTVYQQKAAGRASQTHASLPLFPSPDESGSRDWSESNSAVGTRTRRSRIDWFVKPSDMIADAYWLQQPQHWQFVEDREWRKIFPSSTDSAAPKPGEAEHPASHIHVLPDDAKKAVSEPSEAGSDLPHPSPIDSFNVEVSSRIGSLTGRHFNSPHGARESLQLPRQAPFPGASDSEDEGSQSTSRIIRRAGVRGTNIDAKNYPGDTLVTGEWENKKRRSADSAKGSKSDDLSAAGSPNPHTSRLHSSRHSRHTRPDNDSFPFPHFETPMPSRGSSPGSFVARQSLHVADLPPGKSSDGRSSRASSDLWKSHDELSPYLDNRRSASWSRSNSLGKLSATGENAAPESVADTGGDSASIEWQQQPSPQSHPSQTLIGASQPSTRQSSLGRTAAPEGTTPVRITIQRSSGSRLSRLSDTGAPGGWRERLKASRLDSGIMSRVSKLGDRLGDRLRGKPASDGQSTAADLTDESDSDQDRGRERRRPNLSRRQSKKKAEGDGEQEPKHFLDAMPEFNHAPGMTTSPAGSTNHSRQSSRSDLLKPPGVRSVTLPASPTQAHNMQGDDSDISESGSWTFGVSDDLAVSAKGPGMTIQRMRSGYQRQEGKWQPSSTDSSLGCHQPWRSRREMARVRALMISSGIKAMEITRRAKELHGPFSMACTAVHQNPAEKGCGGIDWQGIAELGPDIQPLEDLATSQQDLYLLAGRTLSSVVDESSRRWQVSAERYSLKSRPALEARIGQVRSRIAVDMLGMTRKAADEADEASRDLAFGQFLKVKHVVDSIETMLRRRRRRFRWIRRAMWLVVEWLLVGFMWYVWFVVMVLRIVVGAGKAGVRGVRWLLYI